MPKSDLRFAVVVASTRPERFAPVVARWFEAQLADHVAYDVLDLAELPMPNTRFAAAIDRADAVVVVTPEYNHSFPGPLKVAIDSLRDEWIAKAVGFVSYGGISGGLRAVEALRLVFAELQAATVRETVSFANPWDQFDSAGALKDPEGAELAAQRLIDQLVWWAATLRAGRRMTADAA
jgi:NAD(P)H-dependent FMN reductase